MKSFLIGTAAVFAVGVGSGYLYHALFGVSAPWWFFIVVGIGVLVILHTRFPRL